jgi:transposase-like protein
MTTQSLLPNDLIDALLSNYKKPEDLIGENGLLKQLTKALVERALQAEMTEHLGHDKHSPVNNTTGNARNGKSTKTLKGDFGALPIEIPRDRHGSFEPQLIPKHQTRWTGFDDKIISLYSRGMTVREIQQHLTEMYGTEVSATLISTVTDAVIDEVKQWQSRPLDAVYPIVYLDCIHVKIRDTGAVRAKAAYLAIGINCNGLIKQDTSKDRFIMSTEVIMSNKNKQIRPSFTLEFNQSAAKLVNEKGYSQRQAADSLGVSLSALSRWVRAERSSSNSTPTQKKVFNLLEQDELTRLRKEVAQLRMEREILKKAAVFFAKELQ